jgi:threonine dehydrogenase-like Zn-dependent dehydrogenase
VSTSVAAVLTAPRRVELIEVPARPPGLGEVSVRVRGCGVCGSNIPMWEGRPWFDYPRPPGEPGHEAWGEIEEVGAGVHALRPGDPVAILSNGAFSDRVVTAERDVVPLPIDLRGELFPGEALGAACNVARRSGFHVGDTVAVVGIGFLGAVVTRLAALAGCRVIAVSRRTSALEVAASLGATETIPMTDQYGVIDAVRELTGGEWCRTVVEAAGVQSTLDLAGQLTGFGARLVVAGYHQDGLRTVDMQTWNWRGFDVINAHERDPEVIRAGVVAATDAVLTGAIDPGPLYTHRYRLDELDQAMGAIAEHPDGFVKALVTAP